MSDIDSGLPIRSQIPGQLNYDDIIIKVGDTTNPDTQQLTVNVDGSVNITDNGGSITVDGAVTVSATDLDIRDLDSAQDSVEVLQAAHDNLNANANLQVGNTDVANGNPVPVSDAGGSLTVDAVDLDIRNLSAAQDNVAISDGTDTLAVNADGSINSVVTATNLDIRDLTHVSDSVRIGDGTDFLAVNADGSINVVPQEDPGTEVVNYNTVAALASGATSNHDIVFTNAGKLYQVLATASDRIKAEVQIETGSATNVFNTVMVGFNSASTPDINLQLSKYASIPAGARVRVIRTNRSNQSQDVYSTIVAIES